MKKIVIILLVLFTTSLVYAGDSIQQQGYLKDKNRNRIFTFSYSQNTTEQQILTHAKDLMNTSGRMTAAYYYKKGSVIPADGVTLAGNVLRANTILYDTPGLSKWDYAYMLGFKGTYRFVNCKNNPDDDLCRP